MSRVYHLSLGLLLVAAGMVMLAGAFIVVSVRGLQPARGFMRTVSAGTSRTASWQRRRLSLSSARGEVKRGDSEGDFVVENDLSKMSADLGTLADVSIEKDDYLFGDSKTFSDLGIHPALSLSLNNINKHKATTIQAATFATVLSEKDTIIAAETGSGKTLAYLLPIIQKILELEESPEGGAAVEQELEEKQGSPAHGSLWKNGPYKSNYPLCVIMTPNKELCSQVLRMTREVCDSLKSSSDRIVTAKSITSFNGVWPYSDRTSECPSIVICTPSYLGNYIRGPVVLDEALFRNVRCLVLDEADMILEGSYQREVEKIMDAFKVTRRRMIREGEIEVHTSVLQNVLAAATLPSFGKKSTEKYIESRFPLAVRISNEHLHKHHPRIKQTFVELQEGEWEFDSPARVKKILEAIDVVVEETGDIKREKGRESTMIFTNTAIKAAQLCSILRSAGVACAEFHKLLTPAEREGELNAFRSGEIRVLVCTDHAARGLDLPAVSHVIQAEFALNVVNHLHRIGRASRAGKLGRATNLYGPESRDLVSSILSDVGERKIDQSFSRRRGFRNKLKKNVRKALEAERDGR